MAGAKRRHLRSRNVMRSMRCAVQNEGITWSTFSMSMSNHYICHISHANDANWPGIIRKLAKCFRAVFIWVSKAISELLWFMITSLSDWFKVLATLFQPIRSETKTNRGLRVHIFPRFVSATCNYFEFWLVCRIVSVLFDWPKQLLWFWFYDTQLKLALSGIQHLIN